EIKVNDNLSVNGYAVGSYQYFDPKPGDSTDTFQVDTALLGSTISFKPVTGVLSLLYTPNVTNEVTLLDAYVTYDLGSGSSLTAGKFLSYLGYESFYPIYMDQISYANGQFLAPIPGYHTGVRYDYSSDAIAAGIAGVDSVYSPFGATKGDGELQHNGGMEAFLSYKAVKNLTLWFGLAYDTKGGFQPHSVTTYDVWASYTVSPTLRIAGEYVYKDGGTGATGYNWLTFADLATSGKFSTAFRISGESMKDGGPSFTKYTICPAITATANLTVRAEYSYIDYSDFSVESANFFGVQVLFKF
ncbi:MAG TPA: outer membrane beta-barrel protein, partial [Candidatus Didemnitutus sp.]|nr:outer membrane beta-barrel protein [Candidatus Didemnitutus sp.]